MMAVAEVIVKVFEGSLIGAFFFYFKINIGRQTGAAASSFEKRRA